MADQAFGGVHYVHAGIGTTDTKKAITDIEQMSHRSAKDLDYYLKFERPYTDSPGDWNNNITKLRNLKYGDEGDLFYQYNVL